MITIPLLLAMISVESGGNPRAVSPAGARGLMQMTEIGIKEVCTQTECEEFLDVSDPETNIWLGYKLLDHYLVVARGDITGALILFNGGYRQYNRYLEGDDLTQETADYVKKIRYKKRYYANFFDRQPGLDVKLRETINRVLQRVGAEDATASFDAWL